MITKRLLLLVLICLFGAVTPFLLVGLPNGTVFCATGAPQPSPELLLKAIYWLNPPDVDLPDDAIVALADFKFKNVTQDELTGVIKAKCLGALGRFISGSDKDNAVVFDCKISGVSLGRNQIFKDGSPYFIIEPDSTINFKPELERAVLSGEAKNCLLVYQRNKDGSATILRLGIKGLDLAPAYEWLEATKNRKNDRMPLSVMILMDKSSPPELRKVAYRHVAFSNLSFNTRLEIIGKAIEVAANPDDAAYGASMFDFISIFPSLTRDEQTPLTHYFLQSLSATKDVRYANVWLHALLQDMQHIIPSDYPDLCNEIRDTVSKHEVTPAPDLAKDMADYESLKNHLLEDLKPKPTPPPEEKPAPPAEGGATPPANEAPAPPPDSGNP